MSLHPIRWAGRPDLTIVKTFKKFSKVKLLYPNFLNIKFRKKRSKNAQSFPFFGISTAIFKGFLPKILKNRRFFLSKKKKAWQKRKLRANVQSSFLVRAPVFSFHESAKKTGIKPTYPAATQISWQSKQPTKILTLKRLQCSTNRKDSMPGDAKSILTVVDHINHWLDCAILHHNRRYYKQLQPIPRSIVGNRARDTAQYTAQLVTTGCSIQRNTPLN